VKRRTGGKSIGRGWSGRAARGKMRVARREGGREESVVVEIVRMGGGEAGEEGRRGEHTTPCFCVLDEGLFCGDGGLFCFVFCGHCGMGC